MSKVNAHPLITNVLDAIGFNGDRTRIFEIRIDPGVITVRSFGQTVHVEHTYQARIEGWGEWNTYNREATTP